MDPKHLKKLEEQKSLIYGDDGFMIFWPDGKNGAYNAHHLREIADWLDQENLKIAKAMDTKRGYGGR
jgi:hypothetical protein